MGSGGRRTTRTVTLVAASAWAVAAWVRGARRRRRHRRRLRAQQQQAASEARREATTASFSDDDSDDEVAPLIVPQTPSFRRASSTDYRQGTQESRTKLVPADAARAARWLAGTPLGFLVDDPSDEALRDAVLERVRWRRYRPGATVQARGALRDTLILVVSGSLAIKALREDDEESDEDEEDHLENVERPTVQRAARSQSLSTAVGLDLDDDRTVSSRHAEQSPREKVVATLGPLEALGKFSVVAAAASDEDVSTSPHRVVSHSTEGGTITCELDAASLRDLATERPAALLSYARRTLSRLHRVARFANREFLRMNTSGDSAAALTQDDYASLKPFASRHAPSTIIKLDDPRKLYVLLEGSVLVGGSLDESRTRRVTAPAVLDGFRFLDDDGRSTTERLRRALQVMASNGPDDHGVVLAKIPEGAFRTNLSIAANASKCLLGVISAMNPDVRAFTDAGLSRRWLHAGVKLMTRGDLAPDHFYVVVTGRVRVLRYDEDLIEEVEDVSRGGVVGLAAALAAKHRLDFDATCLRDSELVAVPRKALDGNGALWLAKLAHGLKGQKEQDEVSTVAITGVDGAGNLAAGANAETLCRSFTAIQEGKALVVTPSSIAKRFGDPWTSHHGHVAPALWRRRVASWLAEREERHRIVVLECFDREDEEDDVVPTRAFARAWARLALAQSDVALVVADAARSSAVAPRRLERRALYGGSELTRKKSIVLLVHNRNAPPPKRSSRWLAARPAPTQGCAPRLLHCVRNDANDLGRVARIVAGRAVGVVLGGGGGRGLGHLGVLRALEEGGLMPDVVAGCSQGAYCAAAYALPQRNDDRLEATSVASEEIARTLTSPPSLAWELTLPLLSVFSGKLFSRAVRRGLSFAWSRPIGRRNDSCLSDESDDDDEALGDARRITRRKVWSRRDVEDCWLPFFCVTTNLTRQQGHSISAGDLVFACRASMSVAELLPPMRCQKTGDLHCDGCYVNNLPVREMRSTGCVRTVVGVSVVDSSGGEFRDVIVYGESGVSGWYLLLRRWLNVLLVCVGRSRDCRKVPSMSKVNATLQVLRNKSQLAEDLEGGTMDLFLEIKPVADFSASCYWRLTRMAGLAADYALPKVRRFVKKRDNLRRKLSASLADRDQASLPALRSALFDSVDRDLDTSSGSRNREPASPRRAVDDLLRRLSSSSLRARHPSDNLRW